MRIGCIVPVWNRENFIGSYLEMMQDFDVKCLVTLGSIPWSTYSDGESLEPDKSELIINKYFPDIEIIKGVYPNHRDSINIGLKKLENCDIIIITDCDMYITRKDWDEFIEWIKSNIDRYDVFSINFERMFIEYYYNHNYGTEAKKGGDVPIVALKPGIEIIRITKAHNDREIVWDVEGPKWHHMRFCKKNRLDRKCTIPIDIKDYLPAPDEISSRLIKWKKILEII